MPCRSTNFFAVLASPVADTSDEEVRVRQKQQPDRPIYTPPQRRSRAATILQANKVPTVNIGSPISPCAAARQIPARIQGKGRARTSSGSDSPPFIHSVPQVKTSPTRPGSSTAASGRHLACDSTTAAGCKTHAVIGGQDKIVGDWDAAPQRKSLGYQRATVVVRENKNEEDKKNGTQKKGKEAQIDYLELMTFSWGCPVGKVWADDREGLWYFDDLPAVYQDFD